MTFLSEHQRILAAELKKLGIPIKLSGFWYLIESILLIGNDQPFTEHIFSKTVYPVIAKRHKVSTESVEIAIRRAIKRAWDSGNEELKELVNRMEIEKPTNRTLISYLAIGGVNCHGSFYRKDTEEVKKNKPRTVVGEQLKLSIVSNLNVW